jgi:hypothetical protein
LALIDGVDAAGVGMTGHTSSAGSPRAVDYVHRLAIVLLLAVGIGAVAVAGWSLAHAGIGWDARLNTRQALITRSTDSSWTLERAYVRAPGLSEFYGVLPQQLGDVLHRLATGSTEPMGADDPVTYAYQAIANLILSVVSVTALAVALAVAFRSVLAAAFAWSVTLATPLWLGMSHVDFKDMPVAAGLTLVTAGVILSLSTRPPAAIVSGVLLGGVGGAIVLASRPGSLLMLMALVIAAAGGAIVIGRGSGIRFLPVELTAVSAIVCGIAFTWATNPFARIDMPVWLRDSTSVARNYPWDGTILTAGRNLRSTNLPGWYVPAWLGAQLPVLTLAALVGGAVVVVGILARQPGAERVRDALLLLPIALQAIVLPLVIVVSGAVLYDGIRHLLFMLPGLISIPAVALAFLTRPRAARPRLALVLPPVAVTVAIASLFASVRWAPYSYAFVNPVAGRSSGEPSWELDYWGVSAREGVRRLQAMSIGPVYVEPTGGVGIPWGAKKGRLPPGVRAGLYVFHRYAFHRGLAAVYPGCTVVFRIERDGHVLGEGARCPAGRDARD